MSAEPSHRAVRSGTVGAMSTHPRADAIAPPPRHVHRRLPAVVAALLASCLLCLAGCTPPGGEPNAPTLPARQFPALADRDPDIPVQTEAFATDGTDVVAVTRVVGPVSYVAFWRSTDAGATWVPGRLSTAAAGATEINESVWGRAAVSVSGSGRRWLALGSKDDDVIAWTSTDGATWDREVVTGIDNRRATVGHLIGTATGFVAVGSVWDEASDDHHPTVWTSADGVAWQAQTLQGEGELSEVAEHDGTLVAVGSHALDSLDDNGRRAYPRMFVSTDAGATWVSREVAEPEASAGFVTQLTEIAWVGDRFLAAGSVFVFDAGYLPWTTSSTDGDTWVVGEALDRGAESSWAADVVPSAQGALLVVGFDLGTRDAIRAYRQRDAGWEQVWAPDLPGDVSLDAGGVSVGGATVLGLANDDGIQHSTVYATPDAGGTWSASTFPAPAGTHARAWPDQLLLVDGQLTGWGYVQGAIGAWTRGDDGSFGAPRIVADGPRQRFGLVTHGEGGYLLIGSLEDEPFAQLSPDGLEWEQIAGPGTFNARDAYHWANVSDAAWIDGRWYVVGTRSENGSVRRSALVQSRAGEANWRAGTAARVFRVGDSYDPRSRATDLDGLENMGRSMSALARTPSGIIAVGDTSDADGNRPAIWRSGDGDTWTLEELDRAGHASATAQRIHVAGDRVVIVGHGRPEGQLDSVPLVWVSGDGGATFSRTALGDQGRFGSLTMTSSAAHGFLVLVGAHDGGTPRLWRSPDGRTWQAQDIAVPNAADGVEAYPDHLVIEGDTLHVLLTVANRVDAVTVIVDVPLA